MSQLGHIFYSKDFSVVRFEYGFNMVRFYRGIQQHAQKSHRCASENTDRGTGLPDVEART